MLVSFVRLMILCVALVASAQTPPAPYSIQWDTNFSLVRVVGVIDPAHLKLANDELQAIFPVAVEPAQVLASIGLPPMIGTYSATPDAIEFKSLYPFEPGVAYRARFNPAKLSSVLRMPRKTLVRTTTVSAIYPSAAVLPQNLLKFYLHFSSPMSGGHIYEHIHLTQEDGTPVELPFLEIDEELWNPEMTRLTLFLDPGRIKREVKPLEDIGPALNPGKKYTLKIDEGWLDASGAPLKESFSKKFLVAPPDREAPDPRDWKIQAPRANSLEPVVVTFTDPMDHALALRLMGVKGKEGVKALGEGERTWSFLPETPWNQGQHELIVNSRIEDLAGNNIGKLFEVEISEGEGRRELAKEVRISFEVH